MRGRNKQTDATDPGTLLKRKQYSIPIFHSPPERFTGIIEDDRQCGEAPQQFCHRCAIRTNEAKSKIGCRREYEPAPSLADMREFVPPAFTGPISPFRRIKIAGSDIDVNIS